MTDRKHSRHHEDLPEPAPSAIEIPEANGGSAADHPADAQADADTTQPLQQQLADAQSQARDNLDGWQRAVAEFQNYKKRVERDRETEQVMMKGDLIKKVLPVLDDLERALQNRPADDAWVNGIELIQRKLQAMLEAEGVERINAEGAVFDPRFHEAISQDVVEGVESGRVAAIIQNGYTLGERVVRPSLVRVAK
jgi:molecular chaperone GrpE